MTNLWECLLQTAYVSLVGVLLLVVKWLLRDKLSPRWQYSVWVVLAARLLVPATLGGGTALLPLSLWVEMAQLTVEQRLSSAYTSIVQSVQVKAPVPWLTGLPHSLTDWLFLPASVIILLQIKISQLHQMAFFCLRKRTISEIRADYILIVAYREFPVPFKLLPNKLLGQPMQVGFRTAMLITAAMRKMPRPNFPQPGYQLRTATQTAISVAMPAFRLNLIYTDEPVMLIQSMMIHHF